MAAHRVGNRDTGVEPGFVILAAFAFEHAADLVQLADIDAAERRGAQHVHKSRRPAVIAGKVHEIFRRVGHAVSSFVMPAKAGIQYPLLRSRTSIFGILDHRCADDDINPTPARGRRDWRCGRSGRLSAAMRAHVVVAELEIEDVEVLGDAHRVRRARNGGDDGLLHQPAQSHLREGLAGALWRCRRAPDRLISRPRASGQ